MRQGYIYLASPYSHPDAKVRQARYLAVLKKTAELICKGHFVFSPIVHGYHLETVCELPGDWNFWAKYAETMLIGAANVWVLMLEGWEQSVGIKAEVKLAEVLRIPVSYLEAAR